MSSTASESDLYIQYGCGLSCPEGWVNFDSSPTLFLQKIPLIGRFIRRKGYKPFPSKVRYASVVRGLPIGEGQCKGVYCSHVLEHLSVVDFRAALRETNRCLASGGTFRLVLPDLQRYIREYLESESDTPSVDFITATALGSERRLRGVKGMLHSVFAGSDHLSMWDEATMRHELQEAGFRDIRRAALGDSHDPRFAEVEAPNRWNLHLGMECVKS